MTLLAIKLNILTNILLLNITNSGFSAEELVVLVLLFIILLAVISYAIYAFIDFIKLCKQLYRLQQEEHCSKNLNIKH